MGKAMIYKHNRECGWVGNDGFGELAKGGSTIAVEELEPWFFAALKPGDFFDKKIGKSRCHPDENFCKKTGREEAEKQAKTKRFTVQSITETIHQRKIAFTVDGEVIEMLKPAKSKRVRLV
jgi:hypothetical protein